LILPIQITAPAPAQHTVSVTSRTGATLNYTATVSATTCGGAWLALGGVTNAATPGSIAVSVNPAGVVAGSPCTGSISIAAVNPVSGASAPNSPLTVPVTMYVSSTPLLSVNPLALRFSAPVSGPSSPASQTI